MNILYVLLCLFSCIQNSISIKRSLVYQMDISEHCRRRVIPSVFLAGNVIDASAYILHLSQLELPYTCYISIRTEAGNNIIMVSKMYSQPGWNKTCNKDNPELLVYEMGETFGGYWGQLPDNIMNPKKIPTKDYTLKTTVPSTTEKSTETETTETPTTTLSTTTSADNVNEGVINIEVPLVEVSGYLEPDNKTTTLDTEALFDLNYDVTPIPGLVYDTSIVPIVQLSLSKNEGDPNKASDTDEFDGRRYDLDIVEPYTIDSRLTWPISRLTTSRYRKLTSKSYRPKQRVLFKKNKSHKGKFPTVSLNLSTVTKYKFPTTQNILTRPTLASKTHYSWEYIDELIKQINETEAMKHEEIEKKNTNTKLLEKIGNIINNSSLYLYPNMSDENVPGDGLTTLTTTNLNSILTMGTLLDTTFKTKIETQDTSKITTLSTWTNDDSNKSSITSTESSSYRKMNTELKEIRYNSYYTRTNPYPSKSIGEERGFEEKEELTATSQTLKQNESTITRSKREVYAIEIEDARPHNETTKKTEQSTEYSFGLSDMQEFGHLVELTDDDMYGHVALRYLRQYVGSVFYNICSFDENSKKNHVQLFNSSRIVLAISNLTSIYRMKLVLTTARTLTTAELRCPDNEIECQVSGTRVCIDEILACDGIPNCGSFDIYDEDRLRCGASQGLEHNVYVAAFTLIAVLLTALYAVHYWLKRCVPRVAEAFFVYKDGTENILYLDSIMRSPHDDTEMGPLFYQPNMLDDILGENFIKKRKLTFWQKFVRVICCGFFWKSTKTKLQLDDDLDLKKDHMRTYSFTEYEINKIVEKSFIETSVQTGSSLELKNLDKKGKELRLSISITSPISIQDSILTLEEPFPEDYVDELSLLKFLNKAKRVSDDSMINAKFLRSVKDEVKSTQTEDKEKELTSHVYNSHRSAGPGTSNLEPTAKDSIKRIRFEETATTIPSDQVELEVFDNGPRRSIYMDAVKGTFRKFLDPIDEDNESNAPQNKDYIVTTKEHKRFWGKNKGKKAKKKTNVNKRL